MNFIYSDTQDLGFTFVCIRKNASTSIGNALYSLKSGLSYEDESFPRDVNGTDFYIYRPQNEIPDLSNTFNFICLRDPFERLVSFFMHKVIHHPSVPLEGFSKFLRSNNNLYIENTFNLFLSYLESTDLSLEDEHFSYQYDCGAFDKIKYDLVLDFNNINWGAIQKNIPGMADLPQNKIHNTNSSDIAKDLKYFEPRVKEIYKKDYDLINDIFKK